MAYDKMIMKKTSLPDWTRASSLAWKLGWCGNFFSSRGIGQLTKGQVQKNINIRAPRNFLKLKLCHTCTSRQFGLDF